MYEGQGPDMSEMTSKLSDTDERRKDIEKRGEIEAAKNSAKTVINELNGIFENGEEETRATEVTTKIMELKLKLQGIPELFLPGTRSDVAARNRGLGIVDEILSDVTVSKLHKRITNEILGE